MCLRVSAVRGSRGRTLNAIVLPIVTRLSQGSTKRLAPCPMQAPHPHSWSAGVPFWEMNHSLSMAVARSWAKACAPQASAAPSLRVPVQSPPPPWSLSTQGRKLAYRIPINWREKPRGDVADSHGREESAALELLREADREGGVSATLTNLRGTSTLSDELDTTFPGIKQEDKTAMTGLGASKPVGSAAQGPMAQQSAANSKEQLRHATANKAELRAKDALPRSDSMDSSDMEANNEIPEFKTAMRRIGAVAELVDSTREKVPRQRSAIAHTAAAVCGQWWLRHSVPDRYDGKGLPVKVKRNVDAVQYSAAGLSEGLTKALLDLDAVESHGDDRIRSARKAQVKHVQDTLETTDALVAFARKVEALAGRVDEALTDEKAQPEKTSATDDVDMTADDAPEQQAASPASGGAGGSSDIAVDTYDAYSDEEVGAEDDDDEEPSSDSDLEEEPGYVQDAGNAARPRPAALNDNAIPIRRTPARSVDHSAAARNAQRLAAQRQAQARRLAAEREAERLAAAREAQRRLDAEREAQRRLAAEREAQLRLAAEHEARRRLAAEQEARRRLAARREAQRLAAEREAEREAERRALMSRAYHDRHDMARSRGAVPAVDSVSRPKRARRQEADDFDFLYPRGSQTARPHVAERRSLSPPVRGRQSVPRYLRREVEQDPYSIDRLPSRRRSLSPTLRTASRPSHTFYDDDFMPAALWPQFAW